jgi:AraC family transcriptional regulator
MNPEIKQVPPRRVAYLRALGLYHKTFPTLWPRFAQLAAQAGLFNGTAARLSIMQDHTPGTPADQLRGDAAVEVSADWQPQHGLSVQTIPGGLYAINDYVGPYEGLGKSWGNLINTWLPTSGHRVRPVASYEIYLNDPRTTPPGELRTAQYLPIEKNPA